MKKEFSVYLDLGMTAGEVATLKLTLQYRKEEMIRNIEDYRNEITEMEECQKLKDLNTTLKYFETTIEDIDNILTKLNLNRYEKV